MPSILLALAMSLACAAAQQTILSIDTRLTYSAGDWKQANVCLYEQNGHFAGDQGGCWNFGPHPCADLFQYTIKPGASVSLKFNGTGIALHTISQSAGLASEITVTLDGADATTYKTEPDHKALTCPSPPFSRSGLAADAEHTVTVTLRAAAGAKPDDNAPTDEFANAPFIGIQSVTITDPSAADSAGGNTTALPATAQRPHGAAGDLRPATVGAILAATLVGVLFA